MRRSFWLMGMLIAFGAHAAGGPPAVNFSLQWRLTPWPSPPVAVVAPDSVSVSTSGPTTTAPGSVTTRTATAEPVAPRLVVRNGGQAQIALHGSDASAPPDWIWTPFGQGLQGGASRPTRRDSLWVQVQWPGGTAPAQVGFRFEQPEPDSAGSARHVDGDLLLVLDQWQEVGHWAAPDGRMGQALQLRLSRLP
ncbi:hypothetical protein AACH06_15870 [Ideonella sp. DXS29W]|uniref:Uncharacterized protein n=1 Tax=Ideonella lacteola TaxID=2984193 RepID=A0ABU9BQS7_9BURK